MSNQTQVHRKPEVSETGSRELSEAEIRDTFAKLGLADPDVRRYFQILGQPPAAEEESVTYWTGLHARTNFASLKSHDAQLE
jgi:hypothetical protein